jgi:hypothetical protein
MKKIKKYFIKNWQECTSKIITAYAWCYVKFDFFQLCFNVSLLAMLPIWKYKEKVHFSTLNSCISLLPPFNYWNGPLSTLKWFRLMWMPPTSMSSSFFFHPMSTNFTYISSNMPVTWKHMVSMSPYTNCKTIWGWKADYFDSSKLQFKRFSSSGLKRLTFAKELKIILFKFNTPN